MSDQDKTQEAGQLGSLSVVGGSAASDRFRSLQTAMAHEIMATTSDSHRAERIARHYLSMAAYAQHLMQIAEAVKYGRMTKEAEEAMKYIVSQITVAHATDLGLELSWSALPNNMVSEPGQKQSQSSGPANTSGACPGSL